MLSPCIGLAGARAMGACGIPVLGVKRLLGHPFWGHRNLWDPHVVTLYRACGCQTCRDPFCSQKDLWDFHILNLKGSWGIPILGSQGPVGPLFWSHRHPHGNLRDPWDPISELQTSMGATGMPRTPILEPQAPMRPPFLSHRHPQELQTPLGRPFWSCRHPQEPHGPLYPPISEPQAPLRPHLGATGTHGTPF